MSQNRLSEETSPYLLQHADNPVQWHGWGPDALAAAKTQNKPILLSVGYAACHWCHVMAHESFEDEAIAAQMNDLYINVKVDREERPDIDTIYQHALLDTVWRAPNMNKLIQRIAPDEALPDGHPPTGKWQEGGRATAYVCIGQTCSLPLTTPAALRDAL